MYLYLETSSSRLAASDKGEFDQSLLEAAKHPKLTNVERE
jgi:hypothetical protein